MPLQESRVYMWIPLTETVGTIVCASDTCVLSAKLRNIEKTSRASFDLNFTQTVSDVRRIHPGHRMTCWVVGGGRVTPSGKGVLVSEPKRRFRFFTQICTF